MKKKLDLFGYDLCLIRRKFLLSNHFIDVSKKENNCWVLKEGKSRDGREIWKIIDVMVSLQCDHWAMFHPLLHASSKIIFLLWLHRLELTRACCFWWLGVQEVVILRKVLCSNVRAKQGKEFLYNINCWLPDGAISCNFLK